MDTKGQFYFLCHPTAVVLTIMKDFDDHTLRTYEMLGTRIRLLQRITKATREQRSSILGEMFEHERSSCAADLAQIDSAGSVPFRTISFLSCADVAGLLKQHVARSQHQGDCGLPKPCQGYNVGK